MKAITLHQPYASLVAHGIKTIETRSWPTGHRGPLAIHAGLRNPTHERIGGWFAFPAAMRGRRTEWVLRHTDDNLGLGLNARSMPLGAVVAVCNLVDVAPMGAWDSFSTGSVEGEAPDFAGCHVLVVQPDGDLTLDHPAGCGHAVGTCEDVTAQKPYGDFAPGRFAWLLEDIHAVDPPIPARGAQRLWTWQ